MSKKAEPSLVRFGKDQLRNLHSAITRSFTDPNDVRVKAYMESARERAFCGVESYQWFKYWYVKAHIFKKYQKGQITAAQRKQAAIEVLLETEKLCRATNDRLFDALEFSNARVPIRTQSYLLRAKRIVHEILGEYCMDQHVRACNFSSGATTEFRRDIAAIPKKWAEGSHITKDALPYGLAFASWAGLRDYRFIVVDGNGVFTVPKNFERDRTCAKEPTWNMFFQKGLGGLMRTKLRKRGLLHPDAQVTHQCLAREASLRGHLTTDDLKSASDCVSLALVKLLTPPAWFAALYRLRSHVGTLPDGDQITYEKISSMGNGYTFELETLIFYALVRAVCGKEGTVSVYGDDLIYPSQFVGPVRELLAFCGFETNVEKSFNVGPFRESCGGHYFKGHSVTPFYITQLPTTWNEIIELHNNIVAYHENMRPSGRLIRVARECRKLIPRSFWGPKGLSGVIWSEWDEARPYYVKRYQAYYVKAVTRVVPKQRHEYYLGSYLQQLWGPGLQQPKPFLVTSGTPGQLNLLRSVIKESSGEFAPSEVQASWVAIPTMAEKLVKRYVGSNRWSERLPVCIRNTGE